MTGRRSARWMGLMLALLVIAADAEERMLPEAFTAHYGLKRNGFKLAEGTRQLQRLDNGRYLYSAHTWPTGLIALFVDKEIEEHSEWTYHQDRIRPLNYRYERTGRKERDVHLEFDWQALKVTNTINGDPWQMDIPPDTYDKLVYQLAIMRDLAAGEERLSYPIADGGKLKTYSFQRQGEETIDTPVGSLRTVKIRREDTKRPATVWCAPALDYLPVRLQQTETDGAEYTMYLMEAEGLPR